MTTVFDDNWQKKSGVSPVIFSIINYIILKYFLYSYENSLKFSILHIVQLKNEKDTIYDIRKLLFREECVSI